ncbi:CDCA2 protein, partial [Thinocorus orbignyianus]|nr:CDCA2 protein [Thinocorus orbignyianus]
STVGVRGSPEHNALIRYLAQQRSSRQKEACTQDSPFKHENVRSLKDKIDAFQMSFQSFQEGEEEPGSSVLAPQNKLPLTKECNLDQCSEKFVSDDHGADLEENLGLNLTSSDKSDTKISSTLSSHQDTTVAEPAAAVSKEWVYEQCNPAKALEAVLIRETLETSH